MKKKHIMKSTKASQTTVINVNISPPSSPQSKALKVNIFDFPAENSRIVSSKLITERTMRYNLREARRETIMDT